MKNFLFPLIILAIFGLAVWYLGRRTAFVFGCSPVWFYVIYTLLLVGSEVLLHHNPCGAQYLEKADVDLYLAGHTHGGQLFPLTLINRRAFQFNKGLYQFGRMQVYTSCGTGSFGPPMRLGTRSELTVLNLQPRK